MLLCLCHLKSDGNHKPYNIGYYLNIRTCKIIVHQAWLTCFVWYRKLPEWHMTLRFYYSIFTINHDCVIDCDIIYAAGYLTVGHHILLIKHGCMEMPPRLIQIKQHFERHWLWYYLYFGIFDRRSSNTCNHTWMHGNSTTIDSNQTIFWMSNPMYGIH